jgi:hypothetical protein
MVFDLTSARAVVEANTIVNMNSVPRIFEILRVCTR